MALETHRMLALSTGHLTCETAQLMTRLAGTSTVFEEGLPIYYEKGEYGFFVPVPDDPQDIPSTCPTDLEACMHFAIAHGFTWLMFDRDADQVPGLTSYEW